MLIILKTNLTVPIPQKMIEFIKNTGQMTYNKSINIHYKLPKKQKKLSKLKAKVHQKDKKPKNNNIAVVKPIANKAIVAMIAANNKSDSLRNRWLL